MTEFRFDDLDLREEPTRGTPAPADMAPSDAPQCCSSVTVTG